MKDEKELKYKCENKGCEKEVGQVIYNFETKKWECVKCCYGKDKK